MWFLFVRPEICPWVSRFPISGFLQIPLRSGHPCLRLYPSHYRADSGLSPVRNVRRQAHKKKEGSSKSEFPSFYNFIFTLCICIHVFYISHFPRGENLRLFSLSAPRMCFGIYIFYFINIHMQIDLSGRNIRMSHHLLYTL